MKSKLLLACFSRNTLALATALAITAAGILTSPAQAALADGEYSCSTGLSAGLTPTYTITSGSVSGGGDCVGAVVIPSGLIGIGSSAFDSSRITSILIPDTVTSIGAAAFYDVTSLTSITIPDSVISIGNDAFSGATGLTSLTIGNSVETIGDYAFQDVNSLTSITIPNSVTTIGTGAFYRMNALTLATISNSVTSISNHAFSGAISLTTVTIPDSVISIGNGAFYGAASLTSITIPNSVTSIGDGAFSYAPNLTAITIPDSVISIGNEAFYGATSLTSLIIGNSVETIGISTFREATSLITATIPASVTSIGLGAFENSSVKKYYFLGNAPREVGLSAFDSRDPFKKAFIQPSAIGFQADTEALGRGDSHVEIFWEGLIVRPAPAYAPSSIYSNWKTPLSQNTSGPKAGDTVYASAFERELSRELYNPDDSEVGNFRTGSELFPTLEEYVYRITNQPNVAISSVDRQSHSSYISLNAEEQQAWYESMGYYEENPYPFSWSAFMCADVTQNTDEFVPRTLSNPNGLTLSYASREDVVRADGFNLDRSFLFRDLSSDLWTNNSPTTRTIVAVNNEALVDGPLIGGRDIVGEGSYGFGVSEVNADCGVGRTLEAFRIVIPGTETPITSKSFVIPNLLTLEVRDGDQYQEVETLGLTIGVTGRNVTYNAALWGLTTIAGVTPPPGANQATGSNDIPSRVPTVVPGPITDRTKSKVFAGFAGDSSKLTLSIRKSITNLSLGFKLVTRVECTGLTSGITPTSRDLLLAKNRAKAACDVVSKKTKNTKILLRVKPANGVGPKFRSVQVKITGS